MKDILKESENIIGRLMGFGSKTLLFRLEDKFKEEGITLGAHHMIILRIILENEGISQVNLSCFILRDKTAVTRYIDYLEQEKFVERHPDENDRRQKNLYITEQGKEMVVRLFKIALEVEDEALKGIEPEKVKICKEVLIKLRENLESIVCQDDEE